MPVARYWRIVGVQTYGGGDLELSELHLYASSGRVDASATITCSHAPLSGSLASLQDADTATVCRLSARSVRSAGFALVWDFGVGGEEITGARLGSGTSIDRFLEGATLQYRSVTSAWVNAAVLGRWRWPGASAYTDVASIGSADPYRSNVVLHMRAGAYGLEETTGRSFSVVGGVTRTTAQSAFGDQSIDFASDANKIVFPDSADFTFASGDFTIEGFARCTSAGSDRYLLGQATASGGYYSILARRSGAGGLQSGVSNGSAGFQFNGGTFPVNAWVHWAFARSGNNLRHFLNGTLIGTTDVTGVVVLDSPAALVIGMYGDDAYGGISWLGQQDEIRGTKGVARYTANFTAPAERFPLASVNIFDPFLLSAVEQKAAQRVDRSDVGGLLVRGLDGVFAWSDIQYGGSGRIYGTTKTKGTPSAPTKARVVLLHQRSKQPVRETWSNPVTGYFEFAGIDTAQQFLTLAEDAAGNFRPVAASRLVPEVVV